MVFGALLLVAWPVFTIGIDVRCSRLRTHGQSVPQGLARAEAVVNAIKAAMVVVVLPAVMLGGIGVFCLVTAGDDSDERTFRTIVGIGALVLLAAYLLFVIRGRSPWLLRLAGLGIVVFGVGCLVAVILVIRDGLTSVGDVVMLVASIVLIAAGLWLSITGRNVITRDPASPRR